MNGWLQIPGTPIWVHGAPGTFPHGIVWAVKPNASDTHYEAWAIPLVGDPELIGTAPTPVRAAALFDQVTA